MARYESRFQLNSPHHLASNAMHQVMRELSNFSPSEWAAFPSPGRTFIEPMVYAVSLSHGDPANLASALGALAEQYQSSGSDSESEPEGNEDSGVNSDSASTTSMPELIAPEDIIWDVPEGDGPVSVPRTPRSADQDVGGRATDSPPIRMSRPEIDERLRSYIAEGAIVPVADGIFIPSTPRAASSTSAASTAIALCRVASQLTPDDQHAGVEPLMDSPEPEEELRGAFDP